MEHHIHVRTAMDRNFVFGPRTLKPKTPKKPKNGKKSLKI